MMNKIALALLLIGFVGIQADVVPFMTGGTNARLGEFASAVR